MMKDLGEMGLEGLINELVKGTGMRRAEAAVHLGKLQDMRAAKPLIVALRDPNMAVRNNVAYSLGELGATEAVPLLIETLRDPEEWVRKSAAKALGMLRSEEAVGPLKLALKDESEMVRKSAVRSLSQVGGSEAMEAILSVSPKDSAVAKMAREALKNLKSARTGQ